jgi:hypothetical protein
MHRRTDPVHRTAVLLSIDLPDNSSQHLHRSTARLQTKPSYAALSSRKLTSEGALPPLSNRALLCLAGH